MLFTYLVFWLIINAVGETSSICTLLQSTDYGLILCNPNGYTKGLVEWLNNGKHGQRINCTKMGTDSLAENTPNAPEFIFPICLPKPKSLGFQWKQASLGVRSEERQEQNKGTRRAAFVGVLRFYNFMWFVTLIK